MKRNNNDDLLDCIVAITLFAVLLLLWSVYHYESSWWKAPEYQRTTTIHARKGEAK